MIIQERKNDLLHTYSDYGHKIRQIETANVYDEAWDKNPCPYTYEETDEMIPKDEMIYPDAD